MRDVVVILLCGGEKSVQKRDIAKAEKYYQDLLVRNIMEVDIQKILKTTASFHDDLVEDLKNPKEAQAFLEAILEEYEKDGDTRAFLSALGVVAEAQGGIGKLAKTTRVSRPHLYEILASKHNPRLDTMLDIFSGLGFRIRLEPVRAPRACARKKKRAIA